MVGDSNSPYTPMLQTSKARATNARGLNRSGAALFVLVAGFLVTTDTPMLCFVALSLSGAFVLVDHLRFIVAFVVCASAILVILAATKQLAIQFGLQVEHYGDMRQTYFMVVIGSICFCCLVSLLYLFLLMRRDVSEPK